jgi:hypothetical protein
MDESMSYWLVLSSAAGTVGGPTAAPVYTLAQAKLLS